MTEHDVRCNTGESGHLKVRLQTKSFNLCEYHCNGLPKHTSTETSKFPEIVIPQIGGYLRVDEAGSTYLDETVVGFFEAGRPYHIEHIQPRPDVTTIFAITNLDDLSSLFGENANKQNLFRKSAIRATPELLMLHRRLLAGLDDERLDQLIVEELATLFVIRAVERSLTAPDLAHKPQENSAKSDDILIGVSEFVRANFKEKMTLDDIAAFSGYSVFHLCRLFNIRMKISLYQYVKSLRMEAAHSAIVDTDAPITDIALDHGFSSHAHFTSQFTNWFGMSPSECRRQLVDMRRE